MNWRLHGAWLTAAALMLGGGYWLGHRGIQKQAGAPHHRHHAQRLHLALADLNGKTRSLADWPAKVYLINFWAPWCPPCRAEIPLLKKVAQEGKTQGLVVIGVALDRKTAVADFVHAHHIDYPVLLGGETGLQMLAEFGDMQGAIPFSLFVSPHGRILTGRLGAYTPGSLKSAVAYALKKG